MLVTLVTGPRLFLACDSENACDVSCPTGTRFTNDGTCACEPFDAGYCRTTADCPDAYCPAASDPNACGNGQEWSTTICACYPLPASSGDEAGAAQDAGTAHDGAAHRG